MRQSAFTQFIYESFEESFERRIESALEKNCIIKLVEFLPLIYKDNQKGLLHAFDELSELIGKVYTRFYETPFGQITIDLMIRVLRQSMVLGDRRIPHKQDRIQRV